jgi:hypothetical protein
MGNQTLRAEQADRRLAMVDVIGPIRRELVDLSRCADDLQDTISSIVARAGPLDLDTPTRLQAADALSQRLDRLARLVGALEAEIPERWTLDGAANSGIGLHQAITRLRDDAGARIGQASEGGGECEFF